MLEPQATDAAKEKREVVLSPDKQLVLKFSSRTFSILNRAKRGLDVSSGGMEMKRDGPGAAFCVGLYILATVKDYRHNQRGPMTIVVNQGVEILSGG